MNYFVGKKRSVPSTCLGEDSADGAHPHHHNLRSESVIKDLQLASDPRSLRGQNQRAQVIWGTVIRSYKYMIRTIWTLAGSLTATDVRVWTASLTWTFRVPYHHT